MILFIHGYASCGLGQKSRCLIDHFGQDQVLAPDLPFHPDEAIALLQGLIEKHPVDLLVGSSLGGYYTTWLNRRNPIPSVLINPAVRPFELLADYLGPHQRWCDGASFDFSRNDADQLVAMYRPELSADERYLVLLQTGDEVLDYHQAVDYYHNHQIIIEQGGNHRFENLADYLPRIAAFRAHPDQTP